MQQADVWSATQQDQDYNHNTIETIYAEEVNAILT